MRGLEVAESAWTCDQRLVMYGTTMLARIYKPAKSAMQSGVAKKDWVLVFEPQSARTADPLTGWITTTDMNGEVRLRFESEAEAVAYAKRHGIPFQVTEPKPRRLVIKAYADNFSSTRRTPWTH